MLFRFAKIPSALQGMKESMSESSRDTGRESVIVMSPEIISQSDETLKMNDDKDSHSNLGLLQTKCPDEKLGFIMCECGLEGISLKVTSTSMPSSIPYREHDASWK